MECTNNPANQRGRLTRVTRTDRRYSHVPRLRCLMFSHRSDPFQLYARTVSKNVDSTKSIAVTPFQRAGLPHDSRTGPIDPNEFMMMILCDMQDRKTDGGAWNGPGISGSAVITRSLFSKPPNRINPNVCKFTIVPCLSIERSFDS